MGSPSGRSHATPLRAVSFLISLFLCLATVHAAEWSLRISELSPSNVATLADEDGDFPDWIELENYGDTTLDLKWFSITESPVAKSGHRLPTYKTKPGERILLFASGKERPRLTPPFHLPFKLRSAGQYLALRHQESQTELTVFAPQYPKQRPGDTYGRVEKSANATEYATLAQATPGEPNAPPKTQSPLAAPTFSHSRGHYQQAFQLELASSEPDSTIRYTTDGSRPTADHGTLYQQAIPITGTRIIRAITIRNQEPQQTSHAETHSYLFLNQVAQQSQTPPGFPKQWGEVAADYEMDPEVLATPTDRKGLVPALQALPSISIVTELAHLFDAEDGIYTHPQEQGAAWERPVSVEGFGKTLEQFQIDSGLRIQGGWFRGATVTRKHSFRLLFKRRYGRNQLNHDLFQEIDATRSFDTLILRAGGNDGYSWTDAKGSEQFIRDEFGRRTVLAMGHPAPRGRFVHLYLNGCYWGLYNLCERPNEDFSAAYLGGDPQHWDAINTGAAKNGNLDAWQNLLGRLARTTTRNDYLAIQGLDRDGTPLENSSGTLHLDPYIDYLLVNMWMGNFDWPDKNYWIGFNHKDPSRGFQFYPWDLETAMGNSRDRSPLDYRAPRKESRDSGVIVPHSRLSGFPEYRSRFADRVQKHFFHDGALSATAIRDRYRHWADQIAPALLAESARWGDHQFPEPRTVTDWVRERDWILNTYIPQRGSIVLNQLRESSLYPRVPTPDLQPTGGHLASGETIQLIAASPEIYYTLDGPDPKSPNGKPHPQALRPELSSAIPLPAKMTLVGKASVWRYAAHFLNPEQRGNLPRLAKTTKWKVALAPLGLGTKKVQSTLAIDSSEDKKSTPSPIILRKTFSLRQPLPIVALRLEVESSDAYHLYLNGQLLQKSSETADLSEYSELKKEMKGSQTWDIQNPSALQLGQNELLVVLQQRDSDDSHLRFDLSAEALTDPSVRALHTAAIECPADGTIRIRTRSNQQWSALTQQRFLVDSAVPQPGDLAIASLAFHPSPPQNLEEVAAAKNSTAFEFLTVTNRSPNRIQLANLRLNGAIRYTFQSETVLPAHSELTLVRNPTAYRARHGEEVLIHGTFHGKLDNRGETLRLETDDGQLLDSVTYSTGSDWPVADHEPGFVLQRKQPIQPGEANAPEDWTRRPERPTEPQATAQ